MAGTGTGHPKIRLWFKLYDVDEDTDACDLAAALAQIEREYKEVGPQVRVKKGGERVKETKDEGGQKWDVYSWPIEVSVPRDFSELDAGVHGERLAAIAKKLKELGKAKAVTEIGEPGDGKKE